MVPTKKDAINICPCKLPMSVKHATTVKSFKVELKNVWSSDNLLCFIDIFDMFLSGTTKDYNTK